MKMEHLIIEGFCEEDINECKTPCDNEFKLGVYCFECSKFSYTYCPNEVALSDEDGVIIESIGFGGDMDPDEIEKRNEYILLWNEICTKKINEAYEEYTKQIKEK